MTNQTAYGKGFEFHLAMGIKSFLDVPILKNKAFEAVERASLVMAENMPKKQQDAMLVTIPSVIDTMATKNYFPQNTQAISFNNDQCGAIGIKADFNLIDKDLSQSLGVSCKHNSYEKSSYQCILDSDLSPLSGLPRIDLADYQGAWDELVSIPCDINWRAFSGRSALAEACMISEINNLKHRLSHDREGAIAYVTKLIYGVASEREVTVSLFGKLNYRYDISKPVVIKDILDVRPWENNRSCVMSKTLLIKVLKADDTLANIRIRFKNGDTLAKFNGKTNRLKPAIDEQKTV